MSNSPLVLPPILIPRAAQRSKSRDNTAAFIWDRAIYYFSVFFPLVASIVVFQIFFVNESTASLSSTLGKLIFASKFIWLGSLLISVTNIIGLMRYGSPMQTDVENLREFKRTKWNKSKQLIVVYVSRGDNHEALGRALKHSLKVLDEFEVNYRVDIVTDIPVSQRLEKFLHSRFHVVPHSYFTSRYAKYKARALHYLVEHRSKFTSEVSFKDTWLLHLDEESLITPECLAGIAKFIKNPRNFQAIGQGEIKYNSHDYGKNLLLTAVDSVRTGDDLGRFRFQYKWLERPIFGMHGSYILVPESIEKSLGFDLGGRGSITEDAYFALHASERGYKFRWVEGFIREQSPFTIAAIIRQRRRWYCGLSLLAFDRGLKFKTRFFLMLNTVLWTIGWLGPIITVINFCVPYAYSPQLLTLIAAAIQGAYVSVYMVGAYRGTISSDVSNVRKLLIYLTAFLFTPLSSAIEGAGVLYGIVRPVKTFDVVRK